MICPRCGAHNNPRALFCGRCKSALPVRRPTTKRTTSGGVAWVGVGMTIVLLLALVAGGGYLLGRGGAGQSSAPAAPSATATSEQPSATPRPATPTARRSGVGSKPTVTPTSTVPRTALPTRSATATATARRATATPTLLPTVSSAGLPTSGASIPAAAGLDEAAVGAAVVRSNDAWTAAMENASPSGLSLIKTDSNLRAALDAVAGLRARNQYYRIHLDGLRVLWSRVLSSTRAQALVYKAGERRVLYRRGGSAPLQTISESYTNLYTLRRVRGRWLVSYVEPKTEAQAARLLTAPPPGLTSAPPTRATPSATPAPARESSTPVSSATSGTATATPTSAAVPEPSVTPAPTAIGVARSNDPVGVVRAFYAAITARDYPMAFGLLSRSLRSQVSSEAAWAAQFQRERLASVTSATIAPGGAASATVRLTLRTVWALTSGATVEHRYVGTWLLVREGGGWRLDTPTLTRVTT